MAGSMSGSWAVEKIGLLGRARQLPPPCNISIPTLSACGLVKSDIARLILKGPFSPNCPLARDATNNGWTAHMVLYQNQIRNLGHIKLLQGVT